MEGYLVRSFSGRCWLARGQHYFRPRIAILDQSPGHYTHYGYIKRHRTVATIVKLCIVHPPLRPYLSGMVVKMVLHRPDTDTHDYNCTLLYTRKARQTCCVPACTHLHAVDTVYANPTITQHTRSPRWRCTNSKLKNIYEEQQQEQEHPGRNKDRIK
ncbi:hypothetical protein CBL_03577 [Carabus blaptoides fortunei]